MASQAQNPTGFRPFHEADHSRVEYLPVLTATTLAKGDAIIIDTLQVGIALANSARLLGVVAEASAAQAAGTLIACWVDPNMQFVGVADADSSSIGLGTEADIIGATGAMMIDASESTTDVLYLISVMQDDVAATALARWKFIINKHALASID